MSVALTLICLTVFNLKGICKNFIPDEKTIKDKLLQKYGEKLIITTKSRNSTIISFTDAQHDILRKEWYEKKNAEAERLRIVEAAAAIIREDILSVTLKSDYYPPSTRMFDDLNDEIPNTLTHFLEEVILKQKKIQIIYI